MRRWLALIACATSVHARMPVVLTTADFTASPSGVVAQLAFDSDASLYYHLDRGARLESNDWRRVAADLLGTDASLPIEDHAEPDHSAVFYRASSTSAPSDNRLLNGDFEESDLSVDAPWRWNGTHQVVQRAPYAAESGFQGVWLKGWTPNLDESFHQDAPCSPRRAHRLEASFKRNGFFASNGGELEMALIWLNAERVEIDRETLNVGALLDTSNEWKRFGLDSVAPANAAYARAFFRWRTDATIETNQQTSAFIDRVTLAGVYLNQTTHLSDWSSFNNATLAAAASYAGWYALADAHGFSTYRIDESLAGGGVIDDLNGMAFTASGRQLFLSTPDALHAFNAGTGETRIFADGLAREAERLGLAHFKGELFAATPAGGIERYDARLDTLQAVANETISAGETIRSMAVDHEAETIYLGGAHDVYALNPTNSAIEHVTTVSNLVDLTFGRVYGAEGQGGLIVLADEGWRRVASLIPAETLRGEGAIEPEAYYETGAITPDLAATACGRLLTAGPRPRMLADTDDERMDFMEWVADEFAQNIRFVKTLCWKDEGNLSGMVNNTAARSTANRGIVASSDAAFWVVNQLLMADEVLDDPEAQGLVREILSRYATLRVNSDGQWYHWYNVNTGELHDWEYNDGDVPHTSCFSTMKAVGMAIRAKNYYPDDAEIVAAADQIIGRLRNQRDYIREFGQQKSPADDLGPVPDSVSKGLFKPYIETHLFSELMAAGDPKCENAYLDYWRYRENHTSDFTLPHEPVVRVNMAGFWRMYDQATIAHCRASDAWREEFANFQALYAGWTDDHAPPHLTAFSAGGTPEGYNADKYTTHPGTVNSFGTVIGFGLHGDTVPVVGAYFAYRDGKRQRMLGAEGVPAPELLTRVSYDDPQWTMKGLSPTDHQYAGFALGEILAPASIDRSIATHTYLEPEFDGTAIRFSRTVRRGILGTRDGLNWESLGFHVSPYLPPADAPYIDYRVEGAEGELLEPIANTTHDVANDFAGTTYIVRSVSTNASPTRARWYAGATLLAEQTGDDRLDAIKPEGATELRVDRSGAAFEQISVERLGAPELFANHDFEEGNLSGWKRFTNDSARIDCQNAADDRLQGERGLLFTARPETPNGKYAQVYREQDISADPANTRYTIEFDALTENLQGSSLRVFIRLYDAAGESLDTQYFDTLERANTRTRLSAGFRKRDEQAVRFRAYVRLRRDDASLVDAEERVLVDHVIIRKMKP